MAETQSTNLKLDLVDGDSDFDTDKVKSNFEKIDTAVGELTEKSTLKVKNGTGMDVVYNDTVAILVIKATELTIESDKTNTQIKLPDGVLPRVDIFFLMPMMASSWYPLNRDVYFLLENNKVNPTTRLISGTTSESNVVVTGYVMLPRTYFSITD